MLYLFIEKLQTALIEL